MHAKITKASDYGVEVSSIILSCIDYNSYTYKFHNALKYLELLLSNLGIADSLDSMKMTFSKVDVDGIYNLLSHSSISLNLF